MQKTNFNYEVLIHDDASTDNTANIIREYEAKYPDIIKPIYQTENQYSKGVGVTRVYQFPRALGKYIALCEGDDYWTDPLKLQKQVDFLEGNPKFSMSFHNAIILDEITKSEKLFCHLDQKKITSISDLIQKWYIPTASIVFRKSFLSIPDWYKNIINGDYALEFLLAEKGPIGYIYDIMSVYRITHKGISSLDQKKRLILLIELLVTINSHFNLEYNELFRRKIRKLKVNLIKVRLIYLIRKVQRIIKIS
jgi:glycosyltransferase involved in cell wall biosynthesis